MDQQQSKQNSSLSALGSVCSALSQYCSLGVLARYGATKMSNYSVQGNFFHYLPALDEPTFGVFAAAFTVYGISAGTFSYLHEEDEDQQRVALVGVACGILAGLTTLRHGGNGITVISYMLFCLTTGLCISALAHMRMRTRDQSLKYNRREKSTDTKHKKMDS